jgi:hypothetical protein
MAMVVVVVMDLGMDKLEGGLQPCWDAHVEMAHEPSHRNPRCFCAYRYVHTRQLTRAWVVADISFAS